MAQFVSNNAAGALPPLATGANASAGGFGASATGSGSTVVGNGSTDNGNAGAIAVGHNASVLGASSIAIGEGTTAHSSAIQQGVLDFRNGGSSPIVNLGTANVVPSGVAIGQLSTVNAGGGVALGYNNVAGSTTGFASTAIGANNLASGGYSTAIGVNNQATNTGAVALGVNNIASGLRSIAVGRQSYATGDLSIAQGFAASSYGANSVAIGPNSVAGVSGGTVVNDVALGSGATATAGDSVALGAGSSATRLGLRGSVEAFSGTSVASANGAVSVGTAGGERQITNVAGGTQDTDAVNIRQLRAVGTNLAGSLGGNAAFDPTTGAYTAPTYTVNGMNYHTVGSAITALGTGVGGSGAFASNNAAGAGGPVAMGANSTSGGYGASATGAASTVLGNGANDTGHANSVVLGNGANIGAAVTAGSNVALGQGATVAANPVGTAGATIGGTPYTFAGGAPAGTVSVGAAGAERTITNVAAGSLSGTSTDAVNGSQLFATNTQVTTNAAAIAGLSNGTVGPVQRGATPNQLVAVAAGGTAAAPGVAQTLTNIAPAALNAGSTDAVNGGQLFTTNANVAAVGAQTTTLGNNVATSLGGGAGYTPGGGLTGPIYDVYGTNQTTVGGALTALQTAAPLQFSSAAGVPNPQVPSNDVALVGAAPGPVALHNVAAGTLAAGSTDAVNGGQLFTTNQQVAALAGGTSGLVQQAGPGAPITVGAGTDGTVVDLSNNTGAARTLAGVAPGAVNATSTQAINGSQLFGTSTSVAGALGGGSTVAADGSVTAPGYTVGGQTYHTVGAALTAGNALAVQYTPNGAGAPTNAIELTRGGTLAPVAMSGLAPGALTGTSTDAVNGSQLFATNQQVAGLANGTLGIVQQDPVTRAITVGAGTDGTSVGFANNAGAARTLTGVADGQIALGSTQAINGGQLFGTANSVAGVLGGGAGVNPDGTISAPAYNVANGTYHDVGSALTALNDGIASGQLGAFVANNTSARPAPSATGADAVAGGFGASATGAGSTAIGSGATDNANANATVVGNGASVAAGLAGSNVALGQGSAATRGAQVAYGAFGLTVSQTSAGEVAIGSAAAPRQITGVAAGSAPTDAVNVAQLRGTTSNLGISTADALGGGAAYDPATGRVTLPSYSLNNGTQTFNNVGAAIGNLDGRTTSNTNAIAGLQAGTSGIVQQDPGTRAITVGAQTDGASVGFANNAGVARRLLGVAPGTLAANSTDAVNGGQLYGTAASVASALGGGSTVNANGTISAPTYSVNGAAYNNVGGAITALDSTGVKYDTAPGGGRGQSITLAGGDPNQPVVIHNVAAGTARTDAANVGQVQDAEMRAKQYTNARLASVENDMSGMNSKLNGLAQDVNQAKRDARTAAAIGLAAASLRYDDRPGKFSIAAGGGYWKGYGAGAFGAGYTLPDGRFRLNATGATDGRDVGAAGGLTYTFN